ncbi:hypothetical protein [Pseudonocardia humida]|uniref:Uncharacterized protein n=1 Tax=Pseudonocardia humida TaxID=2800819 RepID=A0ABT1AA69_9PSEU|nr:hypothetical protein [Pseudonocardia humida]MCO1659861.1 hypothetical protein [Pseudonocardia humida]
MPESVRRGTGGVGLGLAGLADGSRPEVEADLRLRVTTERGECTSAHLTGRGRELRVDVERPAVLLAAVDRRDVGQVADLLAASGVTVRVVGPDGPAATVGAGASSRLGRVVTGSRNVAPVPRAAASLALSTPAARRGLGLLVLAVPAAVLRRRR